MAPHSCALLLSVACRVSAAALDPAPLDAVLLSPSFPYASYGFVLGDASGTQYVRAVGGFDLSAGVSVASSSKWVSQMVLSLLLDDGTLAPSMTTRSVLGPPWGALPPDDLRGAITLASLMSFTSGLNDSVACAQAFSPAGATPASCAADLLAGQDPLPLPATPTCPASFYYSGAHQMLAGYMAVAASGATDWNALFAARLKRPLGLAASTFFTPLSNPHPAGGLYISTTDYATVLHAYFAGTLLSPSAVAALEADHTRAPGTCIAYAPLDPAFHWHYGWGQWLECRAPGSIGPGGAWQPACDTGCAHSSIGLFGTYPYVDRCRGYWALLVVANGTAAASAALGAQLWPAAIAAIGTPSPSPVPASGTSSPSQSPTCVASASNGTSVGGTGASGGNGDAAGRSVTIGAAVGGVAAALLLAAGTVAIVAVTIRSRKPSQGLVGAGAIIVASASSVGTTGEASFESPMKVVRARSTIHRALAPRAS